MKLFASLARLPDIRSRASCGSGTRGCCRSTGNKKSSPTGPLSSRTWRGWATRLLTRASRETLKVTAPEERWKFKWWVSFFIFVVFIQANKIRVLSLDSTEIRDSNIYFPRLIKRVALSSFISIRFLFFFWTNKRSISRRYLNNESYLALKTFFSGCIQVLGRAFIHDNVSYLTALITTLSANPDAYRWFR